MSDWHFFLAFGFLKLATHRFLHHVHDFLLDLIQTLRVASRRATDDIIDLDVIFLFTNSSSIHGIGEFDEH